MKSLISLFVFSCLFTIQVGAWGLTGHRVVGEVASNHLSERAAKRINAIIGNESLAVVSNWMDEIKSDPTRDSLKAWHYATIPKGKTYAETNVSPKGDVIAGIHFVVQQLKTGKLNQEEERNFIAMLAHLVGDLHQPLHVGNGKDRGGNKVYLNWFGRSSNLHQIWDSKMIDSKAYSYTELTAIVDHANEEEVGLLQMGTVEKWAQENVSLRESIYDVPEGKYWEYKYQYAQWDTVKNQLKKGGIRLAGLLNEIYG